MAHEGERERRERERDEEHEVERRVGARVARRADLCSADEGGDEEGGAVHGEDRGVVGGARRAHHEQLLFQAQLLLEHEGTQHRRERHHETGARGQGT